MERESYLRMGRSGRGLKQWKTWTVHLVHSRGYFAITRQPSNPGNLNDLRETNKHKHKVPSIWSLLVALNSTASMRERPIYVSNSLQFGLEHSATCYSFESKKSNT